MKDLQENAIVATKRFCERKGYEIITTCWQAPDGAQADIIADDHGTVCFINVIATESILNGFNENCLSRKEWGTHRSKLAFPKRSRGRLPGSLRQLQACRYKTRASLHPLPRECACTV